MMVLKNLLQREFPCTQASERSKEPIMPKHFLKFLIHPDEQL